MSGRSLGSSSGEIGSDANSIAQTASNAGTRSNAEGRACGRRRCGRGRRAAGWPPRTPPGSRRGRPLPDDRGGVAADPQPGAARRHRRRGTTCAGGGAQIQSLGAGPTIASSSAAASRTVRASGPLVARPLISATDRCVRDPAPRRLDSEQPADARRDPDRAATVAALRGRHQPGGGRGAGAPAGAARRARRGPTACEPGVRRRARCSRAGRTPGCWSCPARSGRRPSAS